MELIIDGYGKAGREFSRGQVRASVRPADRLYDEVLKAVGVAEAHREAGRLVSASVEISAAGDQWCVKTVSDLFKEEALFTPGVQTPTQLCGVDVVSVGTIEGGSKLIQQFTVAGKDGTLVSEFADGGMTTVLSCQGKSAVRKYKRVA
ncbi:lipocalin/fatty-acid binding family protein [Streptomyces sp. NPDC091268]|uniref:lipocalin/fatty-acid binding family protein n=1 Tax=Streptomyces sp. NPDC091268 TaxID=3365979 RepID=UPI0038200249